MDPIVLRSPALEAVLDPPGSRYTAARFDWTTGLRQLRFRGRPLLTREKEGDEDPSAQGEGLAGEFGITAPVGWDECPVGGWAPKLGVGWLKKPDDGPYLFHRPYEVRPARFAVRLVGPSAAEVTAEALREGPWGWRLVRRWRVEPTELILETELTNLGSRPLETTEYIHNFFAGPVGPGCVLTLPRPVPAAAGLTEWVDPEDLMRAEGGRVTWTRTPTRDFFFADPTRPGCGAWTLENHREGWTVTETAGFEVSGLNLWGRGHVVSPELYRMVAVSPGKTLGWTRRWSVR